MTPRSALSFLVVYNLLQNTLFRERGYVAGNLVATGIGLTWAKKSGLGWRELGMSAEKAPYGLVCGVGGAGLAWAITRVGRNSALVGTMLEDQRLDDVSTREAVYRLLVRFPLGTALFEEVWFRGVLPASLQKHGVSRPELVSNVAFAAWHLIPTANTVMANRYERSSHLWRRVGLVVGGSVAAGLGGFGLAELRRSTSSLVAPWLSHAAVNGLTFWAALVRRQTVASL